jgi:hypothetical protein
VKVKHLKPVFTPGKCFDSAAIMLLHYAHFQLKPHFVLCHGIGISNIPKENKAPIAHAWIEDQFSGVAYDSTWGVAMKAEKYRKDLNISYVVRYSRTKLIELWGKTNYPGPWDEKIKAVVKK